MIRALRILSRLALIGAAAFAIFLWYTDRADPPPQIQISIEGEIDHILIEKTARKMTLYQNGQPVRIYNIALGFAPSGDKVREGDGKTPEGTYKIDRRNPQSAFTLSLGINYPLPEDLKRAREGGYSAGGDIFIHGQPNKLPDNRKYAGDWTAGCIALTNPEIREIWQVTPIGTTVEIKA
jgi:murein L,D-transpeptidase YafK